MNRANYRILLISRYGPSSWENFKILNRKDFEVIYEKDFDKAFDSLVKENFDLFIAEEEPNDFNFKKFVSQILTQIKVQNFKGILICSRSNDLKELGPIKKILYTPIDPEDFNKGIAEALSLKARGSVRYLLRMHLCVSEKNLRSFQTCITLNIGTEGMQIESVKKLPVGRKFFWTFQGTKELEGVTIEGTILNEMQREGNLNYRYGVVFEKKCKEALEKIKEFLENG